VNITDHLFRLQRFNDSIRRWPNIIVALIAGSILAVFYQWRRDLFSHQLFFTSLLTNH
jgi:hypothetical protein